jgi:hypothetical protein
MGRKISGEIELDDTYTKVDSFAVDGYVTDIHDFTPWRTTTTCS